MPIITEISKTMEISKAYVETIYNKQLTIEMRDVVDVLASRDIPTELFTYKQIQRNRLNINKTTPIFGFVDSMLTAFRLLNIDIPPTNDYPAILQPYLSRRIWESTVQQLKDQIYAGNLPIFVKPKDRKKRFTGRVFKWVDDIQHLEGTSKHTAIYCSEVVDWVTEYRVYVTNSNIVGIHHYNGNADVKLNITEVEKLVEILEKSNTATTGYAVDLGILSSGQLALVEWNDGFALGSYGLNKEKYTDLLLARWGELTANLT